VAARRRIAGIELRSMVSRSEGMGRERGERGDSVPVTPGMGDGVEGGPPRAAMATAMGARGSSAQAGVGNGTGWVR